RETSAAALGASTSSHCAPTVCMVVPMLLVSTPSHSQRKARCRSGAHAEASAPADPVAVVLFLVICTSALRSTPSQAHPSPTRPRQIASAVISQAYGSRRLQPRGPGRLWVASELLGKLDEASGRQGWALAEGNRERDGRLGAG